MSIFKPKPRILRIQGVTAAQITSKISRHLIPPSEQTNNDYLPFQKNYFGEWNGSSFYFGKIPSPLLFKGEIKTISNDRIIILNLEYPGLVLIYILFGFPFMYFIYNRYLHSFDLISTIVFCLIFLIIFVYLWDVATPNRTLEPFINEIKAELSDVSVCELNDIEIESMDYTHLK